MFAPPRRTVRPLPSTSHAKPTRVAKLAAHLERMSAAHVGNIVDELENVVGAVVLRKTATAANAAQEIRQRYVREAADRFRRSITERNTVIGLAVSGTRTIRSLK